VDDVNIPLLNPQKGANYNYFDRSIDRNPNGGGSGGGGAFDGDWPLKLVQVDTENVKVLLGTVSGFTPTGINTSIDVSSSSTTWAIIMEATISGTSVTAVTLATDSSNTVPSDSATNSYRKVGEVDVVAGLITAVRPSMAWSQNVSICTADTPPYYWTTGA
jgi:hypothetical protein